MAFLVHDTWIIPKIRIILHLMGIDEKVEDAPSKEQSEEDKVKREYSKVEKEQRAATSNAPEPSLGSRVRAFGRNIGNVARNAFDNTVGFGVAKYQNRKTENKFDDASKVVYLIHGVAQNEGSQWRLAKELRKNGYQPYHLKADHSLPRDKVSDNAFSQIDKFHKKANVKEASKRNDYVSGHSSGADVAIYMAGDKKITSYGIKSVQARAPAPYGLKPETIGQKALIPLIADHDNIESIAAKRSAVEMDRRKPKVPVQVYFGKNDQLVRPKDAHYKHASNTYVIDHEDSTHFGTSGSSKHMNRHFVRELDRKHKPKSETHNAKPEYKIQQVYQN